jgi:hypothetical protein
VRRVLPHLDHVQAFLVLARLPCVSGVLVEAVRTAVELGRADLDQFDQGWVQPVAGGADTAKSTREGWKISGALVMRLA